MIGFDWLLVFLQNHVHQSTVVLAMSILVRMLQQPSLLQCFRDGSSASGWLTEAECVVQNRVGVLLGKTLAVFMKCMSMLLVASLQSLTSLVPLFKGSDVFAR